MQKWIGVGVGALIIALALYAMSQLTAARDPDLLWHYPLLGASGIGLVLGQVIVLSYLARYPRLRLQHNLLWMENAFGAKSIDLSRLGPAHVLEYRGRHTRLLYLAFYSLEESFALEQAGIWRGPKLGEMHTTMWLNALVGRNRKIAQSIADVVNARRPFLLRYPLTQDEIDHHLSRLRRRRRWHLAIVIAIAIAGVIVKAALSG